MNLNEALKELKNAGFLVEDAFLKEYGMDDIIRIADAHGWSPEYVYKCMTGHLNAYSVIGRVDELFEKNKDRFDNLENANADCPPEVDNEYSSISVNAYGKDTGYFIEGFIVFDNDDFTSGKIVWDLYAEGGPSKQDTKKFSKLTDEVILELLDNLNDCVTNY